MDLKRIANSLVARLILMGLVLMLLSTAASHFQLSRFLREDMTRVVSAQQITLAQYVARDVDRSLEERRLFLARLAGSLSLTLLQQPARLADWLRERHELHPLFSGGLVLADPSGKVLADYPPVPGRLGLSIADNPDFRAVLGGQERIGRPLIGVSKLPTLPMGAPVRDSAGQVGAVLIGITDLSGRGFLDRLLQGRIGSSGGILLISPRDKLFVASTVPAMVFKATPPSGVNLLHDRAMAGFRGTGTTLNVDGVEEISAIASVPSTGWFVVVRMPTSEALATVTRTQTFLARQRLVATVLVMLAVGLLATWMLRPLYRAARQAEGMARGELPLAPLPVSQADEVGHLTAAFNLLLVRLADQQVELGRMAYHDALTGLPNRKLLDDRLQQALARAQRNATRVALFFLDLDGFKLVNDRMGHDTGDQVLQEVAARLIALVRDADTVARLGGDEFIVLMTDLQGSVDSNIRALAEKCALAVSRPLQMDIGEQNLAASIGVAVSGGVSTPEQVLAAADRAMYQAKQQRRGGYVMAAPLP